jgi:hypothetical protein
MPMQPTRSAAVSALCAQCGQDGSDVLMMGGSGISLASNADAGKQVTVYGWPAGTVITRQVDGCIERFELTEVLRYDGTHAAEPLDRHL